jgi:hypothetical protein
MNGMNGRHDGAPNEPPDLLTPTPGDTIVPPPPVMQITESPTTTFTFQAKIDANRRRTDNTPFHLKALLVALLVEHQKVDDTFHFLPTDGNSTAGAIVKASDIPNDEVNIKKYVKEMHNIDNRNNSKRYTVVFFVKVASTMTLGTMKKNHGLFMWLRDNDVWIKSFNFTTTYDVVNAGFISNMNANLHHRDRVNDIIQTAMKKHYPQLEIQLVPTTIKYGINPQDKRTTHVVSCQADRKTLQESREALVNVFNLSKDVLPKEVFFVPSPVNGVITHELYYNLVRSHHENMANIRSFAISGIENLDAKMLAQDNNDANSSIETTFAKIILNAKHPANNETIFSSIETTSASQTEGRYLLLTNKKNLHAAEHMIDDLIKYINTDPDITNDLSMTGERIRRANKIRTSNEFEGYTAFLLSKVPSTITTNPAPNAWAKRREPMPTDYTNDNYPPLPSKKARVEESDNTVETIDSSEQSDTVIIDLEAELTKERAHTEERISALHRALAEEIDKMKKEFNTQIQNSIEQSEKRMTSAIQEHISDIMKSSDNAINRIEKKANEVADQLLGIMQNRNTSANETNATPRRKNQRHDHDDVDMQEDEGTTNVQVTPASHESRSQYGTDKMASERK